MKANEFITENIDTEATRELGLEPGALAVAAIKATNVVIERP